MGVSLLALARYTLKGPYQAAGVVALLAILAVLLPMLTPSAPAAMLVTVTVSAVFQVLSCALVGLIILTQGSASGLKAISASVLGITLVMWALINTPEHGISIGLAQWLPIILLAQVLRSSKSLSLTLLAGVFVGVIAIAVQYLVFGDLEARWEQLILQRMGPVNQQNPELVAAYIEAAGWMLQILVSLLYLMFVCIVLIARWLQAGLSGSKGFGEEFRALALGKPAAIMAMSIVVAGLFMPQNWIQSLGHLALTPFLLQGVAILHFKLATKNSARLKLSVFYIVLLFTWKITMPLTAITGMVDSWLVFRKKPEQSGNLN